MLPALLLLLVTSGYHAPDTLRQQNLPAVLVLPRHDAVLTPYEGRRHPANAYALVPGVQVAVHLIGTPADPITGLRLHLKDCPVKQGRLKVRLVAAGPASFSTVPDGPELMPPIILMPAQLHAPKGLLSLDLTPQNLTMPAGGVFLILEELGNDWAPEFVTITSDARVVMQGEGKPESTPLEEWPKLAGATSASAPHTWTRGHNGKGWTLRQPKSSGQDAYNSSVELVVLSR